jgi:trehalose 6-phosphate phosphatase
VWINELDKFEQQFGAAGIAVEDKIYSLTLHYRQSKAPHRAKQIAVQAAAQLVPAPRLIFGKAVVNIIPPGTPHKGSAMLKLMRRLGSATALYVGDDDTDEDVFALPDERIVSVRIGRKSLSAARFYLREQSEMASLLTYLLRTYKQQSQGDKNEDLLSV